MSLFEGARNRVRWNGCNISEMYNLYVLDMERNEANQFGVTRSVNFVDNKFLEAVDEPFSIDITFAKLDYALNVERWYNGYIDEVAHILFETKEPCVLEIGGKVYYGIFTSGSIKKINNLGYFTVNFQSVYPYASTPLIMSPFTITENKDNITLENIGINTIYADVSIQCIEDGTLELMNMSNCGYSFKVDMTAGQIVKIYGENKEIIGDVDVVGDLNLLELRYGVNRINTTCTGRFKVIFNHMCELPLI